MSSAASNLVSKVWNYCNLLRDDGVSYGDYVEQLDRKSTRLNSSHLVISYAVFAFKKKRGVVGQAGCWHSRQCQSCRRDSGAVGDAGATDGFFFKDEAPTEIKHLSLSHGLRL